ncbi:hypothetical protein HanRHA438_Chr02g0054191 [Helianthus annuus]|nr:hypothetical protein HanRHA438_Chr02g0054191 [Helianthus annuus]
MTRRWTMMKHYGARRSEHVGGRWKITVTKMMFLCAGSVCGFDVRWFKGDTLLETKNGDVLR